MFWFSMKSTQKRRCSAAFQRGPSPITFRALATLSGFMDSSSFSARAHLHRGTAQEFLPKRSSESGSPGNGGASRVDLDILRVDIRVPSTAVKAPHGLQYHGIHT